MSDIVGLLSSGNSKKQENYQQKQRDNNLLQKTIFRHRHLPTHLTLLKDGI